MNPFRHVQMQSGPDRAHGRRFAALRAAAAMGALLLVVILVVGGQAAAAPQATIVRCDPATVAGPLGSTVDVDIYVQDVVNLWAADVRIALDETVLQVVDVDPSSDTVQIQPLDTFLSPDYTVKQGVEEKDGQTIIWYATTQVNDPNNPKQPVSGSGPLAKITFQALKAGQFTLPIIYQKLVLTNGTQIPAITQGCSVTFFDIDAGGVTFVPFTAAN